MDLDRLALLILVIGAQCAGRRPGSKVAFREANTLVEKNCWSLIIDLCPPYLMIFLLNGTNNMIKIHIQYDKPQFILMMVHVWIEGFNLYVSILIQYISFYPNCRYCSVLSREGPGWNRSTGIRYQRSDCTTVLHLHAQIILLIEGILLYNHYMVFS